MIEESHLGPQISRNLGPQISRKSTTANVTNDVLQIICHDAACYIFETNFEVFNKLGLYQIYSIIQILLHINTHSL